MAVKRIGGDRTAPPGPERSGGRPEAAFLFRAEWRHSRQGKKVDEGRCGRTIEAQPVSDQTCHIEDAVAAPGLSKPEGSRKLRPIVGDISSLPPAISLGISSARRARCLDRRRSSTPPAALFLPPPHSRNAGRQRLQVSAAHRRRRIQLFCWRWRTASMDCGAFAAMAGNAGASTRSAAGPMTMASPPAKAGRSHAHRVPRRYYGPREKIAPSGPRQGATRPAGQADRHRYRRRRPKAGCVPKA